MYYGLNDFTQLRNEQVDFLKKELSSKEFKKAGKRVLIHHIPLYGNDGKNLCANLWTKLLEKAPFNISLNAHTHKYAYHPKGELGNNYPVIIGGGYKMDGEMCIRDRSIGSPTDKRYHLIAVIRVFGSVSDQPLVYSPYTDGHVFEVC